MRKGPVVLISQVSMPDHWTRAAAVRANSWLWCCGDNTPGLFISRTRFCLSPPPPPPPLSPPPPPPPPNLRASRRGERPRLRNVQAQPSGTVRVGCDCRTIMETFTADRRSALGLRCSLAPGTAHHHGRSVHLHRNLTETGCAAMQDGGRARTVQLADELPGVETRSSAWSAPLLSGEACHCQICIPHDLAVSRVRGLCWHALREQSTARVRCAIPAHQLDTPTALHQCPLRQEQWRGCWEAAGTEARRLLCNAWCSQGVALRHQCSLQPSQNICRLCRCLAAALLMLSTAGSAAAAAMGIKSVLVIL